jgi:hypothetical protein
MQMWDEMELALEQSETQRAAAEQNINSFRHIYDQGYVKKDNVGQFQIVTDQQQQEKISTRRQSKATKRGNIAPEQMFLDDVIIDESIEELE